MSLLERIFGRNRQKEIIGREQADDSDPIRIKAQPAAGGVALRANGAEPQPAAEPTDSLPVPSFSVGDHIADTYLIKRVIGSGAMGTVYLAHHERWNIDLVVKVPHQEILADPAHKHRITVEAEAWTDLGMHPHIVYCYYVHPLNGVPLLVIEYLDGGNLRDWIAAGRGADLKGGLDLAIQCCHGLGHAHSRGKIHRDISPENILLASDGTLKVTDFGSVRVEKPVAGASALAARTGTWADADFDSSMTMPGTMGKPGYMAPEQWADAHDVDERTDIFAFGVCLYEMFCGRRPYQPYQLEAGLRQKAPEPREIRGDDTLPDRLCALLKRSVDWDRAQRPESVAQVRQELCAIYEDLFQQPSTWAELPDVSLEADGWNNRGVTYLELGQQKEALHSFERALAANPVHLEATYNQALLQWRRVEIDDVEVLRRLGQLAATPEINTRELALAKAEIHQERFDPAAARAELASYPGLYEERFRGKVSSQVELLRTLTGHTGEVLAVALSGDGRRALSGSYDKTLKLWDLKSGQCLRTLTGHTGEVLGRGAQWRWAAGAVGELGYNPQAVGPGERPVPALYGCRIFSRVGWNYAGCVVGTLGARGWHHDPLALHLEPGIPHAMSAKG